jgi:GT2 family glycosyltransferase
MTAPLVSIVVLNFNGGRWLGPCLAALQAQQGAPPFEIVLVDNASTDGSAERAARDFPGVRLVRNERNLGFAAGNNRGARAARGQCLAFLNNDTVPRADWLARLAAALERPAAPALVASRIVFLDDPEVVDSAGDGYLRAGGAFKRGHRQSASRFGEPGEVFGACGAAFLIRKPVFDALGGFDPRFFMVYEDVDLSYRARLAGHRCWYEADAVVAHAGSGTLGRMSAAAIYYGQRNLEWTWLKNTPSPLLARTALSHALYSLAGVWFYCRAGQAGPAVRGKLAAIKGLPPVLAARRRVQQQREAGAREIDPWLERGWLRRKRCEKAVSVRAAREAP